MRPSGAASHLYCRLRPFTRGQFARLRFGLFPRRLGPMGSTLDDGKPFSPLFEVPSCAVFGRRRGNFKTDARDGLRLFEETLPLRDAPEALVNRLIEKGKFKEDQERAKADRGDVHRGFGLPQGVPPGRDACAADAVPHRAQGARPAGRRRVGTVGCGPARQRRTKKPWKNPARDREPSRGPVLCARFCLVKVFCPIRILSPIRGRHPHRRERLRCSTPRRPAIDGFDRLARVDAERRRLFGERQHEEQHDMTLVEPLEYYQ